MKIFRTPFTSTMQSKVVLAASSAFTDGIKYCAYMIISIGTCPGVPQFQHISHILVNNTESFFVCRVLTSLYVEHLCAYELCFSVAWSFIVTQFPDQNDPFPLSSY